MLIGVGKEKNRLYYFKSVTASALDTTTRPSFSSGHQWLCYPSSFPKSIIIENKLHHCDACVEGKQTQLSFPLVPNKSSCPFDRIFIDDMGWLSYCQCMWCTLFLTIVDDYSHVT